MESLAKLNNMFLINPVELCFHLKFFYSELNLPVDLQLDLFDKLVTPILLYGSEIWAYENNDVSEKLHFRYCEYMLNVNKSTTYSIVYGELGRYPLNIEYTSRCILFWARIISGPVSKLSVKMYNLLFIPENRRHYPMLGQCWVCVAVSETKVRRHWVNRWAYRVRPDFSYYKYDVVFTRCRLSIGSVSDCSQQVSS